MQPHFAMRFATTDETLLGSWRCCFAVVCTFPISAAMYSGSGAAER